MERNKLVIIRGRSEGRRTVFDLGDADAVFEAHFNPTEYAEEMDNAFSVPRIRGLGTPILQYSHGAKRTLGFSLLLDTYASGPEELRGRDVRDVYVGRLELLLAVDGDLHRPPIVKVVWGGLELVGFLVSLRKRFTLFANDGTPVRATVTLQFHEVRSAVDQLKETRLSSPDKTKTRTVREGDTIWLLAYREYGDPGLWRRIAEANDIEDPTVLSVGSVLTVPKLDPPVASRGRL